MKLLLKILAGLTVFAALVVALVFYLTRDLPRTADDFFAAVKSGDIDTAEYFLAEEFKAETSIDELNLFLRAYGLDQVKHTKWHSREIVGNGRGGILEGVVINAEGESSPVKVNLVKSSKGWKIYSIEKPRAGMVETGTALTVPGPDAQRALVRDAMSRFTTSVSEKSMSRFYKDLAALWRSEASVENLDQAFGAFYELDRDLRMLNAMEPRFEPADSLDANSLLNLSGRYQMSPGTADFELSFMREGGTWKLVSFGMDVK